MEYKPGMYFGELALLQEVPRQATVTARGDNVKALCLDRESFQRLLGPLQEILQRNTQMYSQSP